MVKLQEVFIRNLRNERKKAGLTQEKLAEKSGITHSFFGAIEVGTKFPSIKTLESLAKALGVPAYKLFIDSPNVEDISLVEIIDLYNRFLEDHAHSQLSDARAQFLETLDMNRNGSQ